MYSRSITRRKLISILIYSVLFILFYYCSPNHSAREAAVIAVAERFFAAMASRDTTALGDVLIRDGRFFSISDDGRIGGQTHREFIERIAIDEEDLEERLWDPKVLVQDRVAMLWAPYDFHRGGRFSHCGIDAFSMLKTNEGWKIAGIIYSVTTSGCREQSSAVEQ